MKKGLYLFIFLFGFIFADENVESENSSANNLLEANNVLESSEKNNVVEKDNVVQKDNFFNLINNLSPVVAGEKENIVLSESICLRNAMDEANSTEDFKHKFSLCNQKTVDAYLNWKECLEKNLKSERQAKQ